MLLNEIKNLDPSTRSFVVKKWDGNQPDGDEYVEPFDILVTYEFEDLGHSDQPYGEGSAREKHGFTLTVTDIVANQPVKIKSDVDDSVMKTFAKGTKVQDIPGWDEDSKEFFDQKAEEDSGK